jgi:alkylation response protein AidB-like acyl-CoA dehydrogenase
MLSRFFTMTDTIGRQRARVALLGLATAAGALLSASAYAQTRHLSRNCSMRPRMHRVR